MVKQDKGKYDWCLAAAVVQGAHFCMFDFHYVASLQSTKWQGHKVMTIKKIWHQNKYIHPYSMASNRLWHRMRHLNVYQCYESYLTQQNTSFSKDIFELVRKCASLKWNPVQYSLILECSKRGIGWQQFLNFFLLLSEHASLYLNEMLKRHVW